MTKRPGADDAVEMFESDAAPLLAEGWVRVDAACRNRKRLRPVTPPQLVAEGSKAQ